jgi:hypothetical protein
MNDTQRLDWLERDPRRLLWARRGDERAFRFQVAVRGSATIKEPWEFSIFFNNLRDAIDEGMKHTL